MKHKLFVIFAAAVIITAFAGCSYISSSVYNYAEPKKYDNYDNINEVTGIAPRTTVQPDITSDEITEPPQTDNPPETAPPPPSEPPATVPATDPETQPTTQPTTAPATIPETEPPTQPPTQPATQATTQLPTPAPTPAPTQPPTTAPPVIDLKEYADEIVRLTNLERANGNLAPLSNNISLLDEAALLRADEIIILFSHTRPDGRDFGTAYEDLGGVYRGNWTGWGENLAWSSGNLSTPAKTVDGWMNSPGHRANILNTRWTHIGVGVAQGDNGAVYWVQLFFG